MIHTWHHLLTDCDSLDAFLAQHQIESSERLLVQLFAGGGDALALPDLTRHLASRLPGAAIIGTTSYGWLIGEQHQRQGNLLSVCRFDHARLRVQSRPLIADHFAIGQELATELCSDQTKLLLLFASPGHCNAEALLRGIASVAPQVVVAGGMASDQWTFDRCRVMAAGQWYDNAVVATAIDSQQLSLLSEYSWWGIGCVSAMAISVKSLLMRRAALASCRWPKPKRCLFIPALVAATTSRTISPLNWRHWLLRPPLWGSFPTASFFIVMATTIC